MVAYGNLTLLGYPSQESHPSGDAMPYIER
jgi:hypothetical protein